VSLGLEADSSTALFHGLHGILNLVDPALGTPHCNVVVVLIPELQKKKKKTNLYQKCHKH